MNEPAFYFTAQIIQSIATTLGIVAGGIWAFIRFKKKRESESAISLALETKFNNYDGKHMIAFFDAAIKNCGYVKLEARYSCSPDSPYDFNDGSAEIFKHAIDLKIRSIPNDLTPNSIFYWYPHLPDTSIELDLLNTYRALSDENKAFFWMEPGEEYIFGVPVVLLPGLYLAKLTFIGSQKYEYWSRNFLINVPSPSILGS